MFSFFLCSPWGAGGLSECKGPFELYHIERCTDPDCYWSDSPKYNILDESMTSLNSTQELSDNNDLNVIHRFRKNSLLSIDGVSISKVKREGSARSIANPGIKLPNRRPEEEIVNSLDVKLRTDGNVKVSRIKSEAKQKTHRFNSELPEQNSKPLEKTRPMSDRSEADSGIRVTRLHSTLPIMTNRPSSDNVRPSIIENTIHLNRYNETKPISQTPKTNKHRQNVRHVLSAPLPLKVTDHRPSQIDTIELSSSTVSTVKKRKASPSVIHVKRIPTAQKKSNEENAITPLPLKVTDHHPSQVDTIESSSLTVSTVKSRKASPSVVHVKRIPTAQKNSNGENAITPLESITEEAQKEKRHPKTRVQHVPRGNTA